MPCSAVDYTREEAIDVFGLEAKRGPLTPTDRVSAIVVQKDDRKQGLNRHNHNVDFLSEIVPQICKIP